jgi:hypothetical protein
MECTERVLADLGRTIPQPGPLTATDNPVPCEASAGYTRLSFPVGLNRCARLL